MNTYTVTWILTVEEKESPEHAITDCWHRLQAHSNDWIWEVRNEDTGEEWEVDCEPEVWEITDKQ